MRLVLRRAPIRLRRCFSSRSARTDAAYIEQLNEELPSLYEQALYQFSPQWDWIADAVSAECGTSAFGGDRSSPQNILDLASGVSAEPVLTLAKRFPNASFVLSDKDEVVLQQAARRIASANLHERAECHQIDLASLVELGEGRPRAEDAITDVITCSLGLFMLPASSHVSCFRGVRSLLRPGGLLVATVWEEQALLELGGRCVRDVLGRSSAVPLPYDPIALGGGRADRLLEEAGLEIGSEGSSHNALLPMSLHLGPLGEERAWMLGLLPYTGALALLHQQHGLEGVFERARAAFEREVRAEGWVDPTSDDLIVSGLTARLLVARRGQL